MIVALVPAAGKSTRMGCPKLSLPLGNRTVLAHVVEALRRGGAERVLVVVGPHVAELASIAEGAGASALVLAAETSDMRATVEHGLRWIEDAWRPRADDWWLLSPGDHPTLDAGIVGDLLAIAGAEPTHSILIPTWEGKRGHPALIRWRHVAGMRELLAGHGLNVYFRQHVQETGEVPVASADVLADLDTPEDYERVVRQFRERQEERPGSTGAG